MTNQWESVDSLTDTVKRYKQTKLKSKRGQFKNFDYGFSPVIDK